MVLSDKVKGFPKNAFFIILKVERNRHLTMSFGLVA